MKAYERFAIVYDELMNNVDYYQWFKYIEALFEKYDRVPKSILEMACGTGNFTKYLCQNKYKVTSFDSSEEMLAIAYDKLRDYRNIKILKQDMNNFQISDKFDAVLSICDSINYITDTERLIELFKRVFNSLEEDGIFIFDINSFFKLSTIIGDNTFVDENENIFYVWENSFDDSNNICEFYLNFFLREEGKYIRFTEEHHQRAYKIEEIVEGLSMAGFKKIDVFQHLTFENPSDDSERINIIAQK